MTSSKIYWDACAWLALIKVEAGRYDALKEIYESAQRREIEIWTSAFTYAEVFKKACENQTGIENDDEEDKIHKILSQDFIQRVVVDVPIGVNARKLLRQHSVIKKPQDGIHLATALHWDIDILHTFDGSNLLPLDKKLKTRSGKILEICVPKRNVGPLFETADDSKKAE